METLWVSPCPEDVEFPVPEDPVLAGGWLMSPRDLYNKKHACEDW